MNHDNLSDLFEIATEWSYEKYSKKETGYTREYWMAYKLAELIVRECANLAKTKSDSIVERAMKYAEDADEETSAKATAWQFLVFEQEIKKHFGVEE